MRQVILDIQPGSRLWRELSSRDKDGKDWGRIIYRDLLRYYAILNDSSPKFSREELTLLRDALRRGDLSKVKDRASIINHIIDAIEADRLDQNQNVDPQKLLQYLDEIPLADLMKLVDEEERRQQP
jgi:hypothetical protein